MPKKDIFTGLLKRIKNHYYELTEEDLIDIKRRYQQDNLKTEQFCFESIRFYYNDNDLYLENEEDLTEIVSRLLSYINPAKLDEEKLFKYVFHSILVNRSKKENPEKSLKLMDQYLPEFKKLHLRLLVEKAFVYHRDVKDPEKAVRQYNDALLLAKKTGNDKLEGKLIFLIGQKYALEYKSVESCAKAIKYYENSLNVYSKYSDKDSIGMQGRLYYEIGFNLDTLEKYDEAIMNFKKAKDLYENIGRNTGKILYLLASIYNSLENYDIALKYSEKASKVMDSQEIFFLGDCISLEASCHWELGNEEKALEVLKSLVIEFPDHQLISIYLARLGRYYMHFKEYDEAIDVISKAVKKLNKKDEDYISTYIDDLTRIADCYLQKREIQKADEILDELLNSYPDEINVIFSLGIKAESELAKGKIISTLRYVKKTRKLYEQNNILNNMFLKAWYNKTKDLRNHIFQERSLAYALVYPFL